MTHLRFGVIAAFAAVAGCSDPNFVPVHQPVASVRLVPALDSIPFGGSVTLVAQPLDLSGHPTIPDKPPVWTSLTPVILVVDGLGNVHAVWFGPGAVRVAIDGQEAQSTVFVRDPPIDSLSVTPVTAHLTVGDTLHLTATATNAARLPAPTTGIVWQTSDGAVVTVDSTGRCIALAVGSAVVWGTLAGHSDSSSITVTP